ncbi:TRAP transporter small permease [Desulfofundulus thermocisternus]|uniref:TRAP transporter small permease n=1 Tax=Desulfofundulus thermocisternus TaxID=42471 RepID=UPI00217E23F5|nr:TRAP transporter small permease [Desulfofundulus thermocisternus]MCS5695030.1 TRAP transporter small permease [Desulfofundulus thermocisternus]
MALSLRKPEAEIQEREPEPPSGAMREDFLTRCVNVLSMLTGWLLTVTMIFFFLVMVAEVFVRKLAGRSLYGAYEVCGIFMIWISMLGAFVAYREGEFVRLDFVVESFPVAVKKMVELTRQVVVILLVVFLAFSGFTFVFSAPVLNQVTTAFQIPAIMGYLPIPLAFLFLVFACVERFRQILPGYYREDRRRKQYERSGDAEADL